MDTQDRGECFVAPIAGRSARKLGDQSTPSFDTGSDRAPLWDAKGENLLLLEGDRLWRIEVASGQSVEVWRLRGHTLRDVIAKLGASTAWSPDGGRSLVVSAIEAKSRRSSFHRIDLRTGKYQLLIEDASRFATTHATDVNEATGEFTYVAEDMQRPPDVWLANVRTRAVRQVTRLNPAWERFELGEAQLVEWSSAEGQPLRGTLLLPAGYQAGRRYPLIVFVYGGAKGSEYVNRFGIWGDMPAFNFHVLATRGYAVFYPDAPLRVGTPMSDLMHTVIPGVDKVIELGIADPQRMAVMGQSYGSYCVLALIAQSQRFKAAVITAVTDPTLLSDYLEIRPNGVARGIGYYEHGQGNMGSTPWEYRDRYLNNAPVWLFDRIETPLLMAHGTLDFLSQRYPESVFVALRRLGKEVEYRLYENESHAIQRPANVIDFWQRRLEFLDEHFGAVRDAAAR